MPPAFWPIRPAHLLATMAAGLVLLPCGADAQTEASPGSLYDCTTLTDPAKLQQCIVQGQGGRKIRGRLSATPKASNAPIYQDTETPDRKLAPLSSGPP
jgi:hypothetical protein